MIKSQYKVPCAQCKKSTAHADFHNHELRSHYHDNLFYYRSMYTLNEIRCLECDYAYWRDPMAPKGWILRDFD